MDDSRSFDFPEMILRMSDRMIILLELLKAINGASVK